MATKGGTAKEFVALVVVIASLSLVRSNSITGLLGTKCFVVQNGQCPNENVTFWLYTKETQDAPKLLDPLDLNPLDFQPSHPVKILLHGYTGHRDYAPNSFIRPPLLASQEVYVISVDYGKLVPEPCYFSSVENVPLVSKCLGQLINNLVDRGIVRNEDIHLIGYSLGAQVAGQTATYVKQKLKRITGLDPAKPMFIAVDSNRKLDPTDADFVDVIHTDVLGRGMLRPMGHADFYPNIGKFQPGCEQRNDSSSCNHDRAPQYYAESINSSTGFWAYSCPTLKDCENNENSAIMGYFVDHSSRGYFFLKTASTSPFALGRYPHASGVRERKGNPSYDSFIDSHDGDFKL